MNNLIIDWSAIDTLINLLDTLIILIPAVVTFIHFKTHKLRLDTINKTESGIKLCFQNVSKNTIFVVKASLVSREFNKKINITDYFNTNNRDELISIAPDEMITVTLDYTAMKISPIKKGIIVIYNGKKKIKKRIK